MLRTCLYEGQECLWPQQGPSHTQKCQLYLPKHAHSSYFTINMNFDSSKMMNLYLHISSLWKPNPGRKRKQKGLSDCAVSRRQGEKLFKDNKHLRASGTNSTWQNPYCILKLHPKWILKKRARKMKSFCFQSSLENPKTMCAVLCLKKTQQYILVLYFTHNV